MGAHVPVGFTLTGAETACLGCLNRVRFSISLFIPKGKAFLSVNVCVAGELYR